MPVSEVVMICLTVFVLLAPALMVAVLVSGMSRRAPVAIGMPVEEEPAPSQVAA